MPSPPSIRLTSPTLIRCAAFATLAEDLLEVLQHEHVHRLAAGVAPRARDLRQRLRHRLAVGGDRRRLAGREQLADLGLDLGRDRDLGLEAQLLELAAHLLQLELGLGARLLAGGLGAHLLGPRASASTSALIWRSSFCLRCTAACAFVIATSPRARAAASACSAARTASDSATSAVTQDLGDPLAADALEVVPVVGDVLDLEHVELEAQLLEVGLRRLPRAGARTSAGPG